METEDKILIDILASDKIIDISQKKEIEEEEKRTGKAISDIVVDYQIVTKDQLLHIIANHLNTEVVSIQNIEIEKEIIDLLKPTQVRMYGVLPLGYDNSENLVVALVNPLNYSVVEELRFILNKEIHPVVVNPQLLETAIEKFYPTDSMSDVIAEMDVNFKDGEDGIINEDQITLMANNAPIVRFVDVILYQAVKDKASDIHFEPFENVFKIRYRIDGALYELAPPPKNLAMPVISRIKIMSGLNISERRIPQDGRIQIKVSGRSIDLRVSTIPTQYGESVVIRVLDSTVVNLSLDSLGLNSSILKKIRDIIRLPNGIFLVTGPTGSGKTTTLYSCLKEVNKITDKILTAEDPVEYNLEGIIQLPVNNAIDLTFGKALRAFLRQDPDIIMVGEIRDLETAEMAIHASMTGHFVFSTLHTKEAADTVTRLIDMGIMPYLLTSSLVGVLSQRLIRKICFSCKVAYTPTDEELVKLKITRKDVGDKKFYYGKGCANCNNTGYKGRKGIAEFLSITPEVCDIINRSPHTLLIRNKAIEQGMKTIRQDGLESILNGETTVEEVLRYT